MAITVNLKPSGFQPVGSGSLIYQFTESSLANKPNYRIELEFNGLGLPKFEFRPDASLVVRADIAEILASTLALSTSNNLALGSRINSTYVKYQAVWNGGSDAQVSLTSDVIYYFIGSNHFLNRRTKFHTDTTSGVFLHNTITAWRNRSLFIEFLHDNSLPAGSEVRIVNPDASVSTYAFTGNVFAWERIAHTFTSTGIATVQVRMTAGPNTVYASMSIEVLDECKNPLYLRWINDYGGISHWMFDFSQEISFLPEQDQRYQTRRVFEVNLTNSQWNDLCELVRGGTIYNNIDRVGQFVEDVTDPANILKVIVLPEQKGYKTRSFRNIIALLLRYPEIPNSLITR